MTPSYNLRYLAPRPLKFPLAAYLISVNHVFLSGQRAHTLTNGILEMSIRQGCLRNIYRKEKYNDV